MVKNIKMKVFCHGLASGRW